MAERTKWTPEMVERLRELYNRNWTPLEIAQEMGLPFEVVKSKISNEKTKEKKAEKGFTFKLEPDTAPAEEPEPDTPPCSATEFPEQELTEELLTKAEAAAIADFIEFFLFDAIRKDTETDNIKWLICIVRAFDKLCAFSGYKPGSGPDSEEAEE
jgi:hypothetical protein